MSMKKALGQVIVAVVLFGLGFACWTAGEVELGLADAHETLAVLSYDAVDAESEAIERSVAYVPRVPGLTDGLLSDIHGYRAAATYWRGRYEVSAAPPDNGEENDPAVLAFAANAGYRTSQQYAAERPALLRRLDASLKTYTALLAKDPGNADVAYNYEFLVRMRDTLSKTRPPAGRRGGTVPLAPKSTAPVMAGDLPEGRTIHGSPGAPPPDTDMSQFKMHIPLRPEEREENEEAGEGGEKARKG
jgi:hypothetical protein